jgi:hypothetical protein
MKMRGIYRRTRGSMARYYIFCWSLVLLLYQIPDSSDSESDTECNNFTDQYSDSEVNTSVAIE